MVQSHNASEVLSSAFDHYGKEFARSNDPYSWSKVAGHIFGDLLFVVPTVRAANYRAGKFNGRICKLLHSCCLIFRVSVQHNLSEFSNV